MIIVLENGISPREKENLIGFLTEKRFRTREIVEENDTVIGAVGSGTIDNREVDSVLRYEAAVHNAATGITRPVTRHAGSESYTVALPLM